MPVIIDGYNLLWAIQYTDENDSALTDLQMCFTLGRYFSKMGEVGEVVFDGTGPPDREQFFNIDGLDVTFVGFKTDADTVIENKISANTDPKRLQIVTNDRRIKDAARRRKAESVDCGRFWKKVKKTLSSKKKEPEEPDSKKYGIGESETDMWMKYFGLDEDD